MPVDAVRRRQQVGGAAGGGVVEQRASAGGGAAKLHKLQPRYGATLRQVFGAAGGIEVAAASTLCLGGVARAGAGQRLCGRVAAPALRELGHRHTHRAALGPRGHSQLQRDLFTTAVGAPVRFGLLPLGTTLAVAFGLGLQLRRTDLTHQALRAIAAQPCPSRQGLHPHAQAQAQRARHHHTQRRHLLTLGRHLPVPQSSRSLSAGAVG